MPEAVDLGYAFGLPPRRAIEYFKSKGYEISWNWWETWQAAHARSFTVAKAARLDILADIRSEVQRALDEGITAREFAVALEPRLKAKGWWGRQVVVDPAGGAEMAQLGSPRRLKTIYRTNLRVARAQARQQIQRDTADTRPYWMYDAMDDARTRPEHAALDGLVFRHDDPFWDTHYPPNGFNCRCRVRAFTAEEVEARGLTVSSSQGRLRQVEQRVGLDKRTGEIVERPATEFRSGRGPTAIRMTPDPGWNYNPGAGGAGGGLPPLRLSPVAPNQRTWRDLGLPATVPPTAARPRKIPKAEGPAARRAAAEQALGHAGVEPVRVTLASGEKDTLYRRIPRPGGLGDIVTTGSLIEHSVLDKPIKHREQWAPFVVPALRDPGEVWLQEETRGGKSIFREVHIASFPDDNVVIVGQQEPKLGVITWTYYRLDDDRLEEELKKRRVGRLLYRKPEGRR